MESVTGNKYYRNYMTQFISQYDLSESDRASLDKPEESDRMSSKEIARALEKSLSSGNDLVLTDGVTHYTVKRKHYNPAEADFSQYLESRRLERLALEEASHIELPWYKRIWNIVSGKFTRSSTLNC